MALGSTYKKANKNKLLSGSQTKEQLYAGVKLQHKQVKSIFQVEHASHTMIPDVQSTCLILSLLLLVCLSLIVPQILSLREGN